MNCYDMLCPMKRAACMLSRESSMSTLLLSPRLDTIANYNIDLYIHCDDRKLYHITYAHYLLTLSEHKLSLRHGTRRTDPSPFFRPSFVSVC